MTPSKYLTDASYLDKLGTKSAELYVPQIWNNINKALAKNIKIVIPLRSADLDALLNKTIEGLVSRKQLDWERTPLVRRQVFIEAWCKVMQKHGLM